MINLWKHHVCIWSTLSADGTWHWQVQGYSNIAISKQEVSAPISCWMTFDPAESPILHGRNMLCTYASEYNPEVSNEKSQVSLRFIIEIQQILCVYLL